jgi:hypothetical protein
MNISLRLGGNHFMAKIILCIELIIRNIFIIQRIDTTKLHRLIYIIIMIFLVKKKENL